MSCDCVKPTVASSWTVIPELRQPTEILRGENIDCYMRRAGNVGQQHDESREEPQGTVPNSENREGRIINTSITADGLGQVSEQFEVSDSIPAHSKPIRWSATGLPPGTTMHTDGRLVGTIPQTQDGRVFRIMVRVEDANAIEIDSREYTLVPKRGTNTSLSLIMPYVTPDGSPPRVSSTFGPRRRPCATCSAQHGGIDLVGTGAARGRGTIVAAADGEVVFSGNSGGFGLTVRINHFGSQGKLLCQTLYAHNSRLLVTVGQHVSAGQTVAIEGSTGASTGPHLHFEVRLGGTQRVDPLPFIRGTVVVQPPLRASGQQPPDYSVTNGLSSRAPAKPIPVINKNQIANISEEMVNARIGPCPEINTLPGYTPSLPGMIPGNDNSDLQSPTVLISNNPTRAQVQAEIRRALDSADPPLTEEEKTFLMFVAGIESSFIADAKNPNSSARGVFQMLDRTADRYFRLIGVEPTIENRNNPYLATRAQIEFYRREQLVFFREFHERGTLAGIIPPPEAVVRYERLTKAEFIYGLIHHDGVGNAARGRDMQGVDYFRRRAGTQLG